MPLRLIVTRHAKSDWGHEGLSDHDRPLNPRGRRAADALGDWMKARGHDPDEVLCSTAQRTRETWARIAARLDDPAEPFAMDRLYLAPPGVIWEAVRRAGSQVVMVVAHNPGIAAFAATLPEAPPDHPRFADYPSGATTVVEFPGEDWSRLRENRGRLVDFVVPRDLTD